MNRRHTHPAEGEGSYLASISDLMSGLLFVFIITLMVFAISLREEEMTKEGVVKSLSGAAEERNKLLIELKQSLERRGVVVEVDEEHGVLRLKEGILFSSGRADLEVKGKNVVENLAAVLGEVLPCYTENPAPSSAKCSDLGKNGKLEAMLIEGHTDNVPIAPGKTFKDNWELSAARAKTVYWTLVDFNPLLDKLRNQDNISVLSISGYEARRPVRNDDTEEGRSQNRRIDLRFLLRPPKSPDTELKDPEVIRTVRDRLDSVK
jgi:flagellar motor protein MotB